MTLYDAHQLLQLVHSEGRFEDPSQPETVQAMQIALNMPKSDPPSRTELLEAAAKAVVAACLLPEADETYRQALANWYGARIRKVARRARNKAWDQVQELPGVTCQQGSAEARAFQPSPVSEVPAEIAKLQINGTDLPADEPGALRNAPTIYVDSSLEMSVGKAAAQVGHASMLLAADMGFEEVSSWADTGYDLNVREVRSFAGLDADVVVRDAGYTEVAPGSVTVIAVRAHG